MLKYYFNEYSIIKKWYKLSDTAIVEEIGKMLQEVRLQKNYSQSKLAEISELSRATISQLENGRPATLLTFVQVLRALNKFDGVTNKQLGDPVGYGRIKYAYYLMAKSCGIDMAECSLLEEGGRAHFMTKRFDRSENGERYLSIRSIQFFNPMILVRRSGSMDSQ